MMGKKQTDMVLNNQKQRKNEVVYLQMNTNDVKQ